MEVDSKCVVVLLLEVCMMLLRKSFAVRAKLAHYKDGAFHPCPCPFWLKRWPPTERTSPLPIIWLHTLLMIPGLIPANYTPSSTEHKPWSAQKPSLIQKPMMPWNDAQCAAGNGKTKPLITFIVFMRALEVCKQKTSSALWMTSSALCVARLNHNAQKKNMHWIRDGLPIT